MSVMENLEKALTNKRVTVRGKLEEMLINRGMSKEQSIKVLDISIPKMNDIVENYSIDWNSPHGNYPEEIYNVFFISIKKDALNWIIKYKPNAWFKPMFDK